MKNYKIAVAGTGYVGLSLGVLFAQHHQVVAVDIVQAKVDMINNKKSPIQDDYIEKYLAEKDLDLTATLDAKAAFYSARSLPIIDPAIFNNSNSSVFESISIRDNSIFAECNQLPHKDDTEFDGIYIVPARKGKFKVSVSLMCSEYIEPKVHDIEFEIV